MPPYRARPRATVHFAAATAAAALILTGCTAESKDDAAKSSASDGPAAPPAGNVAPGVTADSIKLGIVYPDLSSVKQVLKVDHGDYEAAYNAVIKKINDAGGINGRRIVPVFGKVNVASPAAAQETCVKLTQDEKVFAVIGTFNANDPLCYVQTNKTAVVGGLLTAKNYAQAQAPWFSDLRGGDEVADAIGLFTAGNALDGKKVAVIGVVSEEAQVKETVLPALRNAGITPVETAILDANARDAAAVAQQTGVFVQKFQAAGADTVVVVGGMGTEFPKQLEKTDYRPRLMFTNVFNARPYLSDASPHDYSTVDRAVALGPDVPWDEPGFRQCVVPIEEAEPDLKGKLIVDPATVRPGTPTPQTSADAACRYVTLFKAIADKAGQDLTYTSFQNAGFSLGSTRLPTYADPADYSRATPHGAIPVHLWAYDPATRKFVLPAR